MSTATARAGLCVLGDRPRRVDHLDAAARLAELLGRSEQQNLDSLLRREPRAGRDLGRSKVGAVRVDRNDRHERPSVIVLVVVIGSAAARQSLYRRRCRIRGRRGEAGAGCGNAGTRSAPVRPSCAESDAWRCGYATVFAWVLALAGKPTKALTWRKLRPLAAALARLTFGADDNDVARKADTREGSDDER